jgi:hypothetical protein
MTLEKRQLSAGYYTEHLHFLHKTCWQELTGVLGHQQGQPPTSGMGGPRDPSRTASYCFISLAHLQNESLFS